MYQSRKGRANELKDNFLYDSLLAFSKNKKGRNFIYDCEGTIFSLFPNNDNYKILVEFMKYTIDYIRSGRDHYVMFTDIINTNKDKKSSIDKLKAKYLQGKNPNPLYDLKEKQINSGKTIFGSTNNNVIYNNSFIPHQ